MKRRHFPLLVASAIAACIGAIGCSQTAQLPSPINSSPATAATDEAVTLTVSVAASVQDAMREIQVAYQESAPSVTLIYNFGSSGSLAQQIFQGAPADVFLSASETWMDRLQDTEQILADTRQNLLQNTLVLVVAQERDDIANFADIDTASVGRAAIGEPNSVPAGRYAKEALTALNLFEPLQAKLVFAKNVRQVLSYVETGNVDVGLVYGTDALVSDRVQVVATAPAETHAPIIYPVAVVQDSPDLEAAQAFVDFLTQETATAIFQRHGFIPSQE